MSDHRKNQILEEFRRPPGNKSSRSRDIKARLHHLKGKETFLTDTQTSDYTKSSGQINVSRIQHLEDIVKKLERQNAELRQRIIQLKATQCFEINEEKLKNVIRETDKLRQELGKSRKDLEQSLVQRDFLERFNKNLKTQCERLTKEILVLKANSSNGQSRKNETNIYTSRQEVETSRSRNSSNELRMTSKRKEFLQKRRERQEKESNNLLKGSVSASHLHEDYYGGRTSKARPFKNH